MAKRILVTGGTGPLGDHAVGRITFEQFLAERAGATGDTKARPASRK